MGSLLGRIAQACCNAVPVQAVIFAVFALTGCWRGAGRRGRL